LYQTSVHDYRLSVSLAVRSQKMHWFPYKQKDDWLSQHFSLLTIPVIINSHVRNIPGIESGNEWIPKILI